MASKRAKVDAYTIELHERLEEELRDIRRPLQERQNAVRAKYKEQIQRLTTQSAFEVEVIEQQYLEAEDLHRQTNGTRTHEGPGAFGWSLHHMRMFARQGYGLRHRDDGGWELVEPEKGEVPHG